MQAGGAGPAFGEVGATEIEAATTQRQRRTNGCAGYARQGAQSLGQLGVEGSLQRIAPVIGQPERKRERVLSAKAGIHVL